MKPTLILLLALPGTLVAQQPLKHAPQPTRPAIDSADLMTRAYILADDSMQGRGPGTAGATRATAYIAAELARLKLVPGGDNGTYFQVLPLKEISIGETRLSAGDVALVPGTEFAPYFIRIPADRFRPVEGAQAVYGGVAGDFTRMVTAEQARGKIVVFSMPLRPDGSRQYISVSALVRLTQLRDAAGIASVALDVAPAQLGRALRQPSTIRPMATAAEFPP